MLSLNHNELIKWNTTKVYESKFHTAHNVINKEDRATSSWTLIMNGKTIKDKSDKTHSEIEQTILRASLNRSKNSATSSQYTSIEMKFALLMVPTTEQMSKEVSTLVAESLHINQWCALELGCTKVSFVINSAISPVLFVLLCRDKIGTNLERQISNNFKSENADDRVCENYFAKAVSLHQPLHLSTIKMVRKSSWNAWSLRQKNSWTCIYRIRIWKRHIKDVMIA